MSTPKFTEEQKQRLAELLRQRQEREMKIERGRKVAFYIIAFGLAANIALTFAVLIVQFMPR
jgi:hypothetical protein